MTVYTTGLWAKKKQGAWRSVKNEGVNYLLMKKQGIVALGVLKLLSKKLKKYVA